MRFVVALLIVLSALAELRVGHATVGHAPLRCRLDGYKAWEMVIEGNRLYFTAWDPEIGDEGLVAVDAGTCRVLWRFPEVGPAPAVASRFGHAAQVTLSGVEEFAVASGAVYVVTRPNPEEEWSRLTILDAETGHPTSSRRFANEIDEIAVYAGAVLAYGGGQVHGLRPETGLRGWSRGQPDFSFSDEFVDGLYFLPTVDPSTGLQTMHAVDVLTGADRWAVEFGQGLRAAAYATERDVVLFVAEHRIDETRERITYAYRTGDGEHLWNASGLQNWMMNSDGNVGYGYNFRVGKEDILVAFQIDSGAIDWTLRLEDTLRESAIEAETLVLGLEPPGSFDSVVIGIDRSTGEQLWTQELPFSRVGVFAGLRTVVGLAYVVDMDVAVAIDVVTGREVWTHPLGDDPTFNPVVTSESAVIFTNQRDTVFIFEPGAGRSAHRLPEGLDQAPT